jgi:hypothetical protein
MKAYWGSGDIAPRILDGTGTMRKTSHVHRSFVARQLRKRCVTSHRLDFRAWGKFKHQKTFLLWPCSSSGHWQDDKRSTPSSKNHTYRANGLKFLPPKFPCSTVENMVERAPPPPVDNTDGKREFVSTKKIKLSQNFIKILTMNILQL